MIKEDLYLEMKFKKKIVACYALVALYKFVRMVY
jgi:hypothetical protein